VHPRRECGDLLGRAHVAPEQQGAAGACLAEQALELGVALAGGAVEADEKEIAQARD
jgi:hypothetical protein